MKSFGVKIQHGVCAESTTVKARSHEEAMYQALEILKIPYEDMDSAAVQPTASISRHGTSLYIL